MAPPAEEFAHIPEVFCRNPLTDSPLNHLLEPPKSRKGSLLPTKISLAKGPKARTSRGFVRSSGNYRRPESQLESVPIAILSIAAMTKLPQA
jgi:hypothetical protein